MRVLFGSVAALALSVAAAAPLYAAAHLDAETMTCGDFMAMSAEDQEAAVAAVSGAGMEAEGEAEAEADAEAEAEVEAEADAMAPEDAGMDVAAATTACEGQDDMLLMEVMHSAE